MRDFKKFKVWAKSHQFVLDVYKLTRKFPDEERFGVTSQLRRAAVSVPNNIAEGSAKSSEKDFARFLEFSLSSASECQYLLIVSKDLGYITEMEFLKHEEEIIIVKKQLFQFINKLK